MAKRIIYYANYYGKLYYLLYFWQKCKNMIENTSLYCLNIRPELVLSEMAWFEVRPVNKTLQFLLRITWYQTTLMEHKTRNNDVCKSWLIYYLPLFQPCFFNSFSAKLMIHTWSRTLVFLRRRLLTHRACIKRRPERIQQRMKVLNNKCENISYIAYIGTVWYILSSQIQIKVY